MKTIVISLILGATVAVLTFIIMRNSDPIGFPFSWSFEEARLSSDPEWAGEYAIGKLKVLILNSMLFATLFNIGAFVYKKFFSN